MVHFRIKRVCVCVTLTGKFTLKGGFPICSQGSVHLTLSVPQFEGPTVGSRSIVTRLNTLKLSNVEPAQYLDGRPPGLEKFPYSPWRQIILVIRSNSLAPFVTC